MTPFEAATHTDPYVYYSGLRRQNGLLFDADLRLWIASSAEAVEAILGHPDCRVRPLNEPIPPAIAQGVAGMIFGRLMRMNEGPQHLCPRMVIEPALASVQTDSIADIVSRVVETLDNPAENPDELMFTLPVSVIAALIGFPSSRLQEVARLTRDFVACLSPLSNGEQLAGAQVAADALLQAFAALLREGDVRLGSLLASIVTETDAMGSGLLANLVGLLSQTCDATAGLLGNAIVTLRAQPDLLPSLRAAPQRWPALLREVSQRDPAIHNTRRYTADAVEVHGVRVPAGQMIVVVLASACDAELGFGHGRHGCPGQSIAHTIATACLQAWVDALQRMPLAWRYLPSLNARIPVFSPGEMK